MPLPAIVLPVVLMALLLCWSCRRGRNTLDADIQTDVEFLFHEREPFALVIQKIQPELSVHAVGVLGLPRRRSAAHGAVQVAKRLYGLPLHIAALARPLAVGTGLHADGDRRGAGPLAYDLEQAKRTHLADVVTGAIALHGVAEFFFNLTAMLGIAHFNEVDDDLPADVAQAKLAGDGRRRFHIRTEGHSLKIRLAADLAGVDVDGHKRLGLVEHQTPAGRHEHFAGMYLLDLVEKAEVLSCFS